jgi:hypothetical protein
MDGRFIYIYIYIYVYKLCVKLKSFKLCFICTSYISVNKFCMLKQNNFTFFDITAYNFWLYCRKCIYVVYVGMYVPRFVVPFRIT